MLSFFYRALTDLGAPFINIYLRRRLARGREDKVRFNERFGYPSETRAQGQIIWCHAASVGEAVSLLLLIEKLHELFPKFNFLLTTGTVTAAHMIAPRLPPYAKHQYVPIDRRPCIKRFLDYWQPSLALWIESELWPNTLQAMRRRSIPMVLLNARMSEKSFHNWHRVKGFARELMSSFTLCLAQTESDRGRFIALGAKPVKSLGNLKYASAPLPFAKEELAQVQEQIKDRVLWLMASTHHGEEDVALLVHRTLVPTERHLLTVIVPRHAARGEEIATKLRAKGLNVARRSKGEAIIPQTDIYLADTMGELGLFYALCPVSVLGGSFVRIGGHNPIEAAQLGSAIIFGPYVYNFSEITREFIQSQAAIQVQHSNELSFVVNRLLSEKDLRDRTIHAAHLLAEQKRFILDKIIAEIKPLLTKL